MRQTEAGWQFMRVTQKPITDIVFPAKQQGQQREGDIVQRGGNRRREEVPTQEPAHPQGEKGLKSPQWDEPEEHSDGRAQGDGVGGILELEELLTFVAKPSDRVHAPDVTGLQWAMEQRSSNDRQMLDSHPWSVGWSRQFDRTIATV